MSLKKGKGQASATRYRAAPSSSEAGTCTEHCSVFEMRTKSLNQQGQMRAQKRVRINTAAMKGTSPTKSIGNLAFARASFIPQTGFPSSTPACARPVLLWPACARAISHSFCRSFLPYPHCRYHPLGGMLARPGVFPGFTPADGFASSAPAQRQGSSGPALGSAFIATSHANSLFCACKPYAFHRKPNIKAAGTLSMRFGR